MQHFLNLSQAVLRIVRQPAFLKKITTLRKEWLVWHIRSALVATLAVQPIIKLTGIPLGRTMYQNSPLTCNIVFAKYPEDEIRDIVRRNGEVPLSSLPKRLRRLSMWTRDLERKGVLVRESRKAGNGMLRIYLVAVQEG